MPKKRISVDWNKVTDDTDLELRLFRRFLEVNGLRASTVKDYVERVGRYLKFVGSTEPSGKDFTKFYDSLREKRLSQSTVNNYSFAIRRYHEMKKLQPIEFKFARPSNHIPYYFDEDDIIKIFSSCHNIKHLAMLMTLFYAGLRATELCNLDVSDLDLKALILRVRDGKGGKEALCYLSNEAVGVLKSYLAIRPDIEIDGRHPLFFTDFGRRWDRKDLYRMFMNYKKAAGIEKHGGVHVFARHSLGSILIKNNCDLITVREIMRHSDIHTTMRYLHVADAEKRAKYERCLVL